MQTGNRVEIAWMNQPGRLISRMESVADGFRGSSAIAGAVAVAENSSPNSSCAEKAVAVVRDAFAEGVAYGVENVFMEAVDEINTFALECEYDTLSLAAAAVLENEVWIYSSGTCRIFLSGADSGGRGPGNFVDIEGKGIRNFKLKPGQSIILLTSSLRKLMGSSAARKYSSRCGKPLSFCLSEMIRETRIRFRKKGGSAAAVRLCANSGRMSLPERKYLAYSLVFLLAAAAAVLILCHSIEEKDTPVRSDSVITEEIVMPLD
ncbi:MAG: hypothetical protein K8S24_09570 [Candidatus Aegiribacteria sp.]|nr:hypothetical protein [Candidatus Aegiribacteria sp.]